MALKLTGSRVLVLRDEAAEKTAGGIILPEKNQEQTKIGTVRGVGPGMHNDQGALIPMYVKVGDRVLYADYAGTEVQDTDGVTYALMNERDILAIIEE